MKFQLTQPGWKDWFRPGMRRLLHDRAGAGFSLVELVVVVAILGILAVIMVPVAMKVVDTSRHAGCMSNLRQIGGAMRNFAGEHNGCYPPQEPDKEAFPDWQYPKWHDVLGPYLEKQVSIKKRRTVWICPADTRKDDVYCSYGMNNRASPYADSDKRLIPLAALKGPASKVIYVADTGQNKYGVINTWWKPSGPTKGANLEFRHLGKRRDQSKPYASFQEVDDQGGAATFLFFDGHIETLKNNQLTREMFTGS